MAICSYIRKLSYQRTGDVSVMSFSLFYVLSLYFLLFCLQVLKDGDLSKVQSSWDLPLSNAFSCAADLLYDAVILPEETRKVFSTKQKQNEV